MKKFYYYIEEVKPRRAGGSTETAKIFKLEKGNLVFCCRATWNNSYYMGKDSEVFQKLMQEGFIPKKWQKSSESPWSAGGYFAGDVEKYYSINEL